MADCRKFTLLWMAANRAEFCPRPQASLCQHYLPNYRFGPYELRPQSRELYKQGTKLKLRPQPFQVLTILVEQAGHVVTRAELRNMLWSRETFVDFEHGLNTAIKELRGVLKDSPSEPQYVETLPRLGYRFIAGVESMEVAAPKEDAPSPSQVSTQPGRKRQLEQEELGPTSGWLRCSPSL